MTYPVTTKEMADEGLSFWNRRQNCVDFSYHHNPWCEIYQLGPRLMAVLMVDAMSQGVVGYLRDMNIPEAYWPRIHTRIYSHM